MKSIPIEYDLGEQVEIHELRCPARVLQIALGRRGVEYEVAYWWNAERQTAWLPGFELRPRKLEF